MDYLDQTVAHFAFLEAFEKIISYEKSYEKSYEIFYDSKILFVFA